jgi:hypothetical protein
LDFKRNEIENEKSMKLKTKKKLIIPMEEGDSVPQWIIIIEIEGRENLSIYFLLFNLPPVFIFDKKIMMINTVCVDDGRTWKGLNREAPSESLEIR